jgi:diguanylate cyclase (GGDEF)-like protein/PAS domain S-box-containing protein
VVDDEWMSSGLISARLRQSGFRVETAASGAEALRAIAAGSFDLILLDRLMPGWPGDRVLKELRLSYSPAELPIIMVSAIDDSDEMAGALEMGANDYITKPIDFTVAVARIRSQLLRKRSESKFSADRRSAESERRGEGVWDWNLETDQISYCPRWAAMLGLSPAELTDRPSTWFSRVHAQDAGPLESALRAHWEGRTEAFEKEYRVRCHDDNYRWMVGRGVAFRDSSGRAIRMVGSQADITEGKTLDGLTGLPNRYFLTEHLTKALDHKRTGSDSVTGCEIAVLVIDVDRFKLVNDSLGLAAGDHLLVQFGNRIQAVLQKWRAGGENRQNSMAARLSGDKFGMVLEGVSSPLQAVSIADELLRALRPNLIPVPENVPEGREFACTASIGVALSTHRFQTSDELLNDAEAAMCAAKAQEKDCWALFSESMRDWPKISRN